MARLLSLARRAPTTTRLSGVLALTALAIAITFGLSPVANSRLATGAAISIAVLGLSWLTGWSGQISLGNSAFLAVGGYAAAIWDNHHTSSPIIISLLLATAVGAVTGAVFGLPATRLRGPYLAGVTIALAVVLPEFINNLPYSISGGSGGLFVNLVSPPVWFNHLFSGPNALSNADAQWPVDCAIVVAGLCFFLMANLFHSKTGRAMRLVRDNDVAAELMGVSLPRTRVLAFIIAAAYGGLAGGLMVTTIGTVNPASFPFPLSITLLTVTVLGGIGTLSGAVIGGVIYAFSGSIVSWFNAQIGVSASSNLGLNMNNILFGLILIVTIILAPQGLVGLSRPVRRLLTRMTRRRPTSPDAGA
jgi:branched-chain amino acid transport system permease protein